METLSKKYDGLAEMMVAAQAMGKFQEIHNILRGDYFILLKVTEDNKANELTFNALYRASLRSLFSLIEADIYGLNSLDKYKEYSDKDNFINKFKETFKQIAETWKKEEVQKKYFDSKLQSLLELKKMRDELMHPKELVHLHIATESSFEKLKNVFNDYDTFMKDLMNNFFLSAQVSI